MRRRILQRLIWVCAICLYPIKMTLYILYGLRSNSDRIDLQFAQFMRSFRVSSRLVKKIWKADPTELERIYS